MGGGEEVTVSSKESDTVRFDHGACGKIAVGRHLQLLFEGVRAVPFLDLDGINAVCRRILERGSVC